MSYLYELKATAAVVNEECRSWNCPKDVDCTTCGLFTMDLLLEHVIGEIEAVLEDQASMRYYGY